MTEVIEVNFDNREINRSIKTSFPSCKHRSVTINESLNTIYCNDCQKEVNPIYFIKMMYAEENYWINRINSYKAILKKSESKNKCKCIHCKKMTLIQR